ncbi:hypothetical protein K7432_006060, partial [Basidiobolus ranarum]
MDRGGDSYHPERRYTSPSHNSSGHNPNFSRYYASRSYSYTGEPYGYDRERDRYRERDRRYSDRERDRDRDREMMRDRDYYRGGRETSREQEGRN